MAGQGIRKTTRWLRFFLGLVVAFSGSLLFLMDGACQAQAAESAQGRGNGVRKKFALIDASAPTSRPLCRGCVRTDPSCFLNYMHVTNPSVDTLLSAK